MGGKGTPYVVMGPTEQGRLIQWARWARAQGPQASGASKQPMCNFSSCKIIVTNCVIFHWQNK